MDEHWLCRRCACCGVHLRIHGFLKCHQNAFETKERVQIPFVFELGTANHVVKRLVTSFNHRVRLWIPTGNNLALDTTFVGESLAAAKW